MATEGEGTIAIQEARLMRVIEALSYASIEDYDSCLNLLRNLGTSDDFAELETAFTIFIEELAEAKRQLREALAETEVANRELAAKLATIEMQQAAIRDLSTPIIEVWAGVLCLPVVGIVDSQRSAEMTETLLETAPAGRRLLHQRHQPRDRPDADPHRRRSDRHPYLAQLARRPAGPLAGNRAAPPRPARRGRSLRLRAPSLGTS
jgi:hypothetical protein